MIASVRAVIAVVPNVMCASQVASLMVMADAEVSSSMFCKCQLLYISECSSMYR